MNIEPIVRGVLVTAWKDIRIYYQKAPVYIFGLLLPTFLFLAFFTGRELDIDVFFGGFLAMTLFFTSSSVGPLIVPFEKQSGTFERLLTYPVNVTTIIMGDILAGALFGTLISLVICVAGLLLFGLSVTNVMALAVFFVIGNICFASLGALIAAPAGRVPANVMMLSTLIRFPLIFISGVFIPLSEMTGIGEVISRLSPLTYLVTGMNESLGQASVIPMWVCLVMLIGFTALFIIGTDRILRRNLMKGL